MGEELQVIVEVGHENHGHVHLAIFQNGQKAGDLIIDPKHKQAFIDRLINPGKGAEGADPSKATYACFHRWAEDVGLPMEHLTLSINSFTDDYSVNVAENGVHVHDIQATILHLMGIDHTQLTYRYSGRDMRLTDVHGNVVHDILA